MIYEIRRHPRVPSLTYMVDRGGHQDTEHLKVIQKPNYRKLAQIDVCAYPVCALDTGSLCIPILTCPIAQIGDNIGIQ